MIMTRLPEPLLSAAEATGGFSAVRTAVGPEGPRMSLACLGLRLLLGFCTQASQAFSPLSSRDQSRFFRAWAGSAGMKLDIWCPC